MSNDLAKTIVITAALLIALVVGLVKGIDSMNQGQAQHSRIQVAKVRACAHADDVERCINGVRDR